MTWQEPVCACPTNDMKNAEGVMKKVEFNDKELEILLQLMNDVPVKGKESLILVLGLIAKLEKVKDG